MGNHASPLPDDAVPWHIELARRLARRVLLAGALATCVAVVAVFSYASVALSLSYFGPGRPAGNLTIGCTAPACGPGALAPTPIIPSFSAPASPAHHATPKPSHTASHPPRPSPSPTHSVRVPAPPPTVTVTYVARRRWDRGFEGGLTIANHGTASISAWEIAISLPGDWVSSVWDAVGRADGDVLILQPAPWDPAIPPGGELSVGFVADGPTTSPVTCTYNGAPCA